MLSLARQLASSRKQHRSVRFFSAQENNYADEDAIEADLELSGDRGAYEAVSWRHWAWRRRCPEIHRMGGDYKLGNIFS